MKTVFFKANCLATYRSCIDVPDDISESKEETLSYIRKHLDECEVFSLEKKCNLPNSSISEDSIFDMIECGGKYE